MVALASIVKNNPGKSTTYLGADGQQYTLSGDLSQRANNPGNLSPVSAASRQYYEQNFNVIGYVKSSNGPDVAVFATPQDGARAQQALWASPKYQNMTIEQAAKSWAASPYVNQLAAAAGVDKSTKVSDLSQTQMQQMFQVQTGIEGSRKLSIAGADGAPIERSSFFPESANSAVTAINQATAQPAPAPMPGRPAALSGAQAAAPTPATPPASLRLPSGKMIAPGVYPSSNPGHQVQITAGANGNAVITPIHNPGEIPGVIDPLHESQGTIAGSIIHKTVGDIAAKAAPVVQQATTAVQNAGTAATQAVQTEAANLGGQVSGALGGLGNLLGFGKSPTPGPQGPTLTASGSAGAPTNAMASSALQGASGAGNANGSQQGTMTANAGVAPPAQNFMAQPQPTHVAVVAQHPVTGAVQVLAAHPVANVQGRQIGSNVMDSHGNPVNVQQAPAAAPVVQRVVAPAPRPVVVAQPAAPVNVMAPVAPRVPVGVAAVANQNYYQNAMGDSGSAHSGSGGGASNGYLFG